MRKGLIQAALGALVAALVLGAPAAWGKLDAKPADNVVVTNTAANPVPTTIVGTPAVTVSGTPAVTLSGTPAVTLSGTPTVNVGSLPALQLAGTPTVKVEPAREPYQTFVAASHSAGGEDCQPLAVPAGKRLVLEFVTVEAQSLAAPQVYLLITASDNTGGNLVRPIEFDFDASAAANRWGASESVLLHGGSPAPGSLTFAYRLCMAGAVQGSFRAFASGWLENA